MKRRATFALLTAGALLLTTPAIAGEHEIRMLNNGSDKQTMVFEPAFLKIEPGDTVTFVPTDNAHNAETIPEMLPDGAEPFKGKFSQGLTVTFEKPGLYGYRCLPHLAMGMVGLIQVGDNPSNLDEAKSAKLPGIAAKRMAALFEKLSNTQSAHAD